MDAVTYPDPAVQQDLVKSFAGLKIDQLARHPDYKAASLAQRVIWAPTFVFSDARGREIRRFVGWLPPAAFRAELGFVRAYAAYQNGDFPTAAKLCDEVVEAFPAAPVAPECLYWGGTAAFLAGKKDWAALKDRWGRAAAEHGATRFGIHASVIEDAPQ
jgi:hypothetical protein